MARQGWGWGVFCTIRFILVAIEVVGVYIYCFVENWDGAGGGKIIVFLGKLAVSRDRVAEN